jgi:thiol:disulfide interchange protein
MIFTGVGLGLSLPFILTAFIPSLIKLLPKPGSWMEKLKMLLGLSLLLTAVWLYDVFAALVDLSFNGIYLNTFLVMLFFAFFFRKHISKIFAWNTIFFLIPAFILFSSVQNGLFDEKQYSSHSKDAYSALDWEAWDENEFKSYEGIVFVNFTASWCLTCKVNKKLVLETTAFEELVNDNGIRLMEGDWTQRDEMITNFLKKYNVISVPAYFIKLPDGNIKFLGETISISKIQDFL